jgi:transposase-like protein
MAEARTASRMARLVAQWRKSGESGASFAQRHQIPAWTFWYWRRKLSGTSAVVPAPAPTFVPVQVTAERAEPVIEIVLSGGERLQVRAGASADLVRAAVSALRSPC